MVIQQHILHLVQSVQSPDDVTKGLWWLFAIDDDDGGFMVSTTRAVKTVRPARAARDPARARARIYVSLEADLVCDLVCDLRLQVQSSFYSFDLEDLFAGVGRGVGERERGDIVQGYLFWGRYDRSCEEAEGRGGDEEGVRNGFSFLL
ncbi:hypothetical protein U1Q18_012151 [Sarracenia purpurea var. burkii]